MTLKKAIEDKKYNVFNLCRELKVFFFITKNTGFHSIIKGYWYTSICYKKNINRVFIIKLSVISQ